MPKLDDAIVCVTTVTSYKDDILNAIITTNWNIGFLRRKEEC